MLHLFVLRLPLGVVLVSGFRVPLKGLYRVPLNGFYEVLQGSCKGISIVRIIIMFIMTTVTSVFVHATITVIRFFIIIIVSIIIVIIILIL